MLPLPRRAMRRMGARAAFVVALLSGLSATLRGQAPTITTVSTPRQVVTLGQSLTLSVTASSGTTPTYQWKRNGLAISGATSPTYSITGAQPVRDKGWYQVVATNDSGSTTSAVVFVNVAVSPGNVFAAGSNSYGQTTVPTGLTNVAAITGGSYHNLALKSDGTVVAWGNNGDGQTTVPTGMANAVAIASGSYHSLALKSEGTVVAWGNSSSGQTTVPAGLTNVVAIAGGYYHSLALKFDGTVVAWGYNGYGQTTVPAGLANVVAIAGGDSHSMALKSDGTVVAWGNTSYGQTTVPTGLANVVAIAGGYYHSVALKSDGTVIAWGYNGYGQTTVPTGLANVVAIACGSYHNLALKSDGTVVGWGNNNDGQATVPVGFAAVAGIAAGANHSLMLRNAFGDTAPTITTHPDSQALNLGQSLTFSVGASFGSAPTSYQWRTGGVNIAGATSATYTINEVVAGSTGSYDVVVTNYLGSATSNAATLTVNSAPIVSATGNGRYVIGTAQNLTLTLASSISASASVHWKRNGVPISGATGRSFAITNASRASAGYYQAIYNEGSGAVVSAPIFVLIVPTSTQLVGWGSNSYGSLSFPTVSSRFVAIAANRGRNVGLLADGTVVNWGGYSPPVALGNVVAVAAGSNHFLALKADGTVVQWGDTGGGQASLPSGLSGAVAIAAGNDHSLALKTDGTVVAWGSGANGATAVPAGLSGIVGIAAGDGFGLALKSDGTVVGWGNNGSGQSSIPSELTNVVVLSAGSNFSLALKFDGTVVAWGASGTGPALIPAGLMNVVGIAAGNSHALALKSDGSVVAWGGNNSGQTALPAGLNSVFDLAAGNWHSLALRDSSGDLVPMVTTQPASVSAFAGQNVMLGVTATGGTSLLSYQWRKDGTAITGATSATLSLPRVTAASSGNYDAVVTNQLGAVTSQLATLSVNSSPAVTTNVSGQQIISAGQSFTLTASVAIPGPVIFQWRRDGRVISGATGASYTITNVTWRDTGAYQVIATNSVGPVTSSAVFVGVSSPTQVRAWGNNSYGQAAVPLGLTGVMAIAAGSTHSLALKNAGTVVGWGSNFYGQTDAPAGLNDVVAVAAGSEFSMALRADGTIVTWGIINYTPSGLANVVAIDACGEHAMALRSDGTVVAWTSASVSNDVPAGLADVVLIAAGSNQRVVLKADGTVVAWGSGTGATVPAGLSGLTSISSGNYHVLGLKSDGTIVAWGRNGNGETNIPAGLSNVIGVAAGGSTSYALKADGSVAAWGYFSNPLLPTDFPLTNVISIAGGNSHTVALRDASADTAPLITASPANLALGVGQNATFTVSVAGTAPFTYQWRKDGAAIAGATNIALSLSNIQAASAGSYDVIVTNSVGTITSAAAALTVNLGNPPILTSHPQSGTVAVGGFSNFVVGVSSATTVSYQWRFNGVPVAGATGAGYGFTNTQLSQAGNYDVVVTNAAGSVTSQVAMLTVVPPTPPIIITQPVNVTQFVGGNGTFSVSVTGTNPLAYQWRKGGVNVANATGASFTLSNLQLTDAGSYDVVITNSAGSATSSALTLTMLLATQPTITSQPVGGTLNVTNVAQLRVTATGSATFSYQWRKDGVPIAGAVGSIYTIGPVATAHAGTYDVVVSNVAGSMTSTPAVLFVNAGGVSITAQPISVATFVGATAVLSVSATGSPTAPTFQWRKNGVAIAGATSATLAFSSAQLTDAGTYDVVASNAFATVTSTAATLTVGDTAPQITVPPVGTALAVGGNVTLSSAAVGSMPLTYQWRRNGLPITGATSTTFTISNAQTYHTGVYDVVVSNGLGSATSAGASVNIVPRVVAYSARLMIDTEGSLGVFTIEGTLSKKVLLRAVGPGLAPFGLSGLPDPQLELFDSSGALIAINNDWSTSSDASEISATTAAVGAFALAVGSRDSAIIRTLPPGTYTVRAAPASGTGGTGYLELYDADLATAPMSTLPYVAIRGKMAAGGGVVIGGLGSNGRGQRSYLVRAVGPGLGLPGALANPSMLIVRDSTLVGSNDDWDANAAEAAAVMTATTRVAAFTLPAGGRDSALVLTGNLHAGACTVQVGSSDAIGGTVLLELHDLDDARPTNFAPLIASQPLNAMAAIGEPATLRVVASGTGPLSYQWRKDGVPIAGATMATWTIPAVQPSNGGSYSVIVSNTLGSATSLSATLAVQGITTGASATHAVAGNGYVGGGTATITNTLSYTVAPTSLGWSVTLPAGWTFVSDSGATGDVKPTAGATGTLEWAWSVVPAGSVTFTYTVGVPAGTSGNQQLLASAIVRSSGSVAQPVATPNPLVISQATTHSADTNSDFRLSLLELTRVIELYNTRNGTTRTGCYAAASAVTEDGFAIDATRSATATVTFTRYHSADSNRDGKLSLLELTRIIELYNYRSGTTRTGQYHLQAGTEDGYAAGP